MKLLELNLEAYGPFTGRRIEFGASDAGLHVIHGPNEAGKSSALRALRASLYGIPAQTPDNFLHAYGELRVGATLCLPGGEILSFVRRKGRLRTLRSEGGDLIEESTLRRFVPIEEPLFNSLYGIDHESLSRGGRELLKEHGEIGRAIFSAGLGGINLRALTAGIDKEADELFRPKASNPAINALIARYAELVHRERESALPADTWREKRDALDAAKGELEALEAELAQCRGRLNRLLRLNRVLPRLAGQVELRAAIEALGEVPTLPEDLGERRSEAQARLEVKTAERETAGMRLAATREALEQIPAPDGILERADAVLRLVQRVDRYREGADTLPRLQGQLQAAEREAGSMLVALRPGVGLEQAATLRVPQALRERIKGLADEYAELTGELRRVRERAAEIRSREESTRTEIAALPEPHDTGDLARAIETASRHGDLEAAIREAEAEERSIAGQCEDDLGALGLGTATTGSVLSLPIPMPETVDVYEARFSRLSRDRESLAEALDTTRRQLSEETRALEAMQRDGEVPAFEALSGLRERRERGWDLVRRAWLNAEDVGEEARGFDPEQPLPRAYERSVAVADEYADRLYSESEAVHRQAATRARIADLKSDVRKLTERIDASRADTAALESGWAAAWKPAGISPRTPREMRAWLTRLDTLRGKVINLGNRRAKTVALRELVVEIRAGIESALRAVGDPPQSGSGTLIALLARARERTESETRVREERSRLDKVLRQLANERRAREESERLAEDALARWRASWSGAVVGLGLERDALPREARAVLERMDRLFTRLDELDALRERIALTGRELERFREQTRELVDVLEPGLERLSPDLAVIQLHGLLDQARTQETRRQSLLERIPDEENAWREAGESVRLIEQSLAGLRQSAGCEGDAELQEILHKVAEKRRLEDQLEFGKRALLESGDGLTLDELAREAENVDPDKLPAQIDLLERRIGLELEPARGELEQRKGALESELAGMSGGDQAAALAVDAQETLADLRDETERYMRLRIASRMLKERIEAYRSEHQGPVLARAGELFGRLTLGAFTGLRPDYDDQDRPVIEGLAPGGAKRVEQMSAGTRDQLYLALRLATLERYLVSTEPMPFVVDDILVQFDDERTAAALEVLAGLGSLTQVILFTHHRQVARQASALGEAHGVALHELGA